MEHLEKIPYIISVFFPSLLFLLAGLGLAWWLWYNEHAKRLDAALEENEKLNTELSKLASSGASKSSEKSSSDAKKSEKQEEKKATPAKETKNEPKKEEVKKEESKK